MRKVFGKIKTAIVKDPKNNFQGSMSTDNLTFLHGKITIKVLEARNVEGRNATVLSKIERVISASYDGVDPYCTVKLAYNNVFQTPVIENNPNPKWNSSVVLDVAHEFDFLEFRVKAAKRKGPLSLISKVKHLSMHSIPAEEIVAKKVIEGWFPLSSYRKEITAENPYDDESSDSDIDKEDDVRDGDFGEICLHIAYQPIEEVTSIRNIGVPDCYYPVREGVKVTLYQDSECTPNSLGPVPIKPDYKHARCWVELCKALMESTELIYITGWAVWPELHMVRTHYDGDEWGNLTLGEILKKKADEGVTVCVMVWDEVASNMFSKGIMATHDEEIISYFRGSKVTAVKVPRQNDKDGPFADLNDSLMFTHHQKSVVVSRFDANTGKNRLEAWLGGLDLTDGRYDSNDHSLFRTLQGVHAAPDFWQACALEVGAESGPREPWHDIHTKVTGPIAWDVLENFAGRWRRQVTRRKHGALHPVPHEQFVTLAEELQIKEGSWNVQLLRSINESSAELDPSRPGTFVRRRALIDNSIHLAYIHCIRRAKNFIYIENQYFLGSSHMWDKDSKQRGGFSSHLVAIELAQKICAKIRANERFAVYVVVPMYPEGPPDSGAVQEILAHQRKTVSVITTRIAKTIKEVGSDTTVADWFNLFCLVNRESFVGNQGNGGTNEKEKQLSESRRFMVYVHSKFAVFDDELTIVGSANINSRSMDGARDSEIASLSWQPDHLATGSTAYGTDVGVQASLPRGDVAAFRYSLWAEHLGNYFPEMKDPASKPCIHKVREMAMANWSNFAGMQPEASDMPHGHLAYYPYAYDPVSGETLSSADHFPDFGTAAVRGQSSVIPNSLTG